MPWWASVGVGIAAAVLAFLLFVFAVNALNDRDSRKRQVIRQQQSVAEREMQQIVQNTISQMLDSARLFR